MLLLVIKRMLSSRWIFICLLTGSILAAAMVCAIPIYSNGILQRMLIKDLENYQYSSSLFTGSFQVKSSLTYGFLPEGRLKAYQNFNEKITKDFATNVNLPALSNYQEIILGNLYIPLAKATDNAPDKLYVRISALTGLTEHMKIIKGRVYSDKTEDGAYEVIMSQEAMKNLKLSIGDTYQICDPVNNGRNVFNIRVVGIFDIDQNSDPYWSKSVSELSKSLIMNYNLFNQEFVNKENSLITDAEWFYAFDYHKISIENVEKICLAYDNLRALKNKYSSSLEIKMPVISIIDSYSARAAQLKLMLWVLTVPLLIMLAFYIFMITQLIVENDKNDIAVLKSRGASKKQIFLSYLIYSMIIGLVAFITGPPLGLLICRMLGSSNGFLEFVQRTALPLSLNAGVYLYDALAFVFLIVTIMIPVILSSRVSIVNYKQSKARQGKAALWKRLFLDFILIGISAYGFYGYDKLRETIEQTGINAVDMKIDPLLFLTYIFFVLGIGLFFLRVYPYIIRFIYLMGRKIWSPVTYFSLIQVGRSKGQEQFLILFIILTISTGIFNANSARTINKNIEERIRYSTGADITLMAKWKSNKKQSSGSSMVGITRDSQVSNGGSSGSATGSASGMTYAEEKYFEPDYTKYANLSGVCETTKVMISEEATLQNPGLSHNKIRLMGIIPDEFGRIAWFRPDLLPYRWYYYLNMMTDAPTAFLLSSNYKNEGVKLGDTIYLTFGDKFFLRGVVYAFIDYWPTYNPNPSGKSKSTGAPGLIVANLAYIQSKLPLQPYEVWIKKEPGATDKQISDDITSKDLSLDKVNYANQEIVKMKNDPMLQGTNGSLTMGFIVAMIISLIGFLIYWILSIQKRTLQFGILRAMGLSLAQVIGMLAWEQILISGAAILMGILIGGIASENFIPLLSISYDSENLVPPFKIVSSGNDFVKIYIMISLMLIIGFIALWRLISKVKINQAVKLGED